MRVALVGEDACLGAGLRVHLLRWGRHDIKTLSSSKSAWKSERKLRKALRQLSPDILIDLRFSKMLDDAEFLDRLDLQCTEWIARICERESIFLLQISNSAVFSGQKITPYVEDDAMDSTNENGRFFIENEEMLRRFCKAHLILRLGPVYAAYGSNTFTALISDLAKQEEVRISTQNKESPLHASDGARVIAGIIDQISAGAKEIGTFHYCGSEAVSSYEFSEVIFSLLLKSNLVQSETKLLPVQSDKPKKNFVLNCEKIQDSFAIRQISWKQFLPEAVKNYYSAR